MSLSGEIENIYNGSISGVFIITAVKKIVNLIIDLKLSVYIF